MTYHAILTGIDGLERSQENYSQDLRVVQEWAKGMSARHPQGNVEVRHTIEVTRECWVGGERKEILA